MSNCDPHLHRSLRIQAQRAYRDALKAPEIRRDHEITGCWQPDPSLPADQLLQGVEDAHNRPLRTFKSSAINRVVEADLLGQSVIIKRFEIHGIRRRLLQPFRPTRARRAWAAARALHALAIPAGEALGFLETSGHPSCVSYTLFTSDPGLTPARRFIKAWLHQRPAEFRHAFCDQLVQFFNHLYQHGIYHADTKASNILVRDPEDPARRTFVWIDLECVAFGVTPTRRQVLRNLVQLNGSVGSKLPAEDRRRFLEGLAERFPWLRDEGIEDAIERRTRERLERERRGLCGF